jgi:hypothetical protein
MRKSGARERASDAAPAQPKLITLSLGPLARGLYPQFHIRPMGVQVQHGPKLPPL